MQSDIEYDELKPQAPEVEGEGRVERIVRSCNNKKCKAAIIIFWIAMSLAGVIVMPTFMKSLKSTIPPVAGTDAKAAQDAMNHYFYEPRGGEKGASIAMLVTARDGSPLLNYTAPDFAATQASMNQVWYNTFAQPGTAALEVNGSIVTMKPGSNSPITQIVCSKCPASCAASPSVMELPKNSLDLTALELTMPPFLNSALILNMAAVVPPDQQALVFDLYEQLKPQMFTPDGLTSLTAVSLTGCDDDVYRDIAEKLQKLPMDPSLKLEISSLQLMTKSIQAGVDSTMDLSTLTLPLALLVLAGMLTNFRLVLCTVVNVLVSITSAILLMFPIAATVDVTSVAPSMMIAVALAMSIDYSLFLLSRFQSEAPKGAEAAAIIMLETSGRIVLVSGGTLLLCFMTMLVIPVQLISMMGVCSAVTVFFTITVALTLTPTLLLCCPGFFLANRRFGLSCDGCPCNKAEPNELEQEYNRVSQEQLSSPAQGDSDPEKLPVTRWVAVGHFTQRYAIPIFVLLFSIAIPLGVVYLPEFKHALGMIPMMPRGTDSYNEVQKIQTLFGVSTVFPMDILLVPAPGSLPDEPGRGLWMHHMCTNLSAIGAASVRSLKSDTTIDFTGPMMVNGHCLYNQTGGMVGTSSLSANFFGGAYQAPPNTTFSKLSSLSTRLSTTLDVFSQNGQDWIKAFRNQVAQFEQSPSGRALLGVGGKIYLEGEGCNQLDNSKKAYDKFIPMLGLMMGLVVLLLGLTFRSVVVPVRAVLCLLWMIAMTFGLCIAIFQYGWLDGMGWHPLEKRELGAMYWMSPLVSFSIIVGLGLDYDIFYTERVLEEKHNGYTDSEAAVRALAFTANTISAAGLIMVMAFSALLVSTTASMNEISLLLIIGILCDCFVTTKLIIPASIAILDGYNFWPTRSPLEPKTVGTPEGCKLLCSLGRCCNGGNV